MTRAVAINPVCFVPPLPGKFYHRTCILTEKATIFMQFVTLYAVGTSHQEKKRLVSTTCQQISTTNRRTDQLPKPSSDPLRRLSRVLRSGLLDKQAA
jgi:hypothetical protein